MLSLIVWRKSSSILKRVLRNLITVLMAFLLWSASLLPAQADEISKGGDAFFAGSVTLMSPTQIMVSRVVRGQPESRRFTMTPQTKVEGKLAVKVRVTVRYISDDDGETATLIVVRSQVRK